MQFFLKLFGDRIQWVYRCFDRIVVNGYLSFLTRENNVVYFFREICCIPKITKEVLGARTQAYRNWVQSFATKRDIPIAWAPKGARKETIVAPFLKRMERRQKFGVYFIMQSMEQGPSFRILSPKFPTKDPNHQFLRKSRSRYTHYYFYIRDEIAGPMVLRIGTFLPFQITAILNGHSFIERQLIRRKVPFQKLDNRFMSVADPKLLQRLADGLDYHTIQSRIQYWAFTLGPKFSKAQQHAAGGLRRLYAISQIELCHNVIFKRDWPIKSIFERSCELGLHLLSADRIAKLFGQQVTRRLSGKLQTVVERLEKGHFVLRSYFKSSFLKQYQKCARFLRGEIVCNNLKDFRLRKSLCYLGEVRTHFNAILDRFAETQAQLLNVHGQFDIVGRLAKPITRGKSKVAGIKLENTRLMRLMEMLLQGACDRFRRWTTADLHDAILDQFNLSSEQYTLTQLRYDLRKLRVHGIIQRLPRSYSYSYTKKGLKIALLFTQLRKRIYAPVAFSLFRGHPNPEHSPESEFERAYNKLDKDFENLIALLAA